MSKILISASIFGHFRVFKGQLVSLGASFKNLPIFCHEKYERELFSFSL